MNWSRSAGQKSKATGGPDPYTHTIRCNHLTPNCSSGTGMLGRAPEDVMAPWPQVKQTHL